MVNSLRASAQKILEDNILSFWWNKMRDPDGGFYGRMDGYNILHPDAPRGAVMNARLLWAFSAAYRVLRKPEYLEAANWAKSYIETHFLDREQGGAFWSVNADGSPLDTKKQTYAQGFMIYAFSEYARATGDEQAKQTAINLFNAIEAHAFNEQMVNGKMVHGYVEALTRDWQPIADMRLSDKDENAAFTMNTHLHVLEPYTNLYRIWPDERLRQRLIALIGIFSDHLYNPKTHHVDCFFDIHWNGRRDIASYGHDIEAAWLLNEAFSVLLPNELKADSFERRLTHRIAHASLEGLQPDGSMIHEAKMANDKGQMTHVDASRQWWVLCEQVIGCIDQWQLTEDEAWFRRVEAAYRYIETYLVDHEQGEWYWAILPDGSIDRTNDKAGFWKCPYHNTRMCLEIIERLNK